MNLHVARSGNGRDLLLLHGWAMASSAWDEPLPELERRFRVHRIDLPGHGRSPWNAPSFDATADTIAAMVPAGAVLCGWSLGGLLAQAVALRLAGGLGALVLVGSTPCFVARDDWPDAMRPQTLAHFSRGLHDERERTLREFVHLNARHGSHAREAVRAFAARIAASPPAPGALEATLGWLRDVDLRGRVPRIACETLLVHGARDALAPLAAAEWLAARLRRARLVALADAAHLPFFTHRDAFVAALEPLRG